MQIDRLPDFVLKPFEHADRFDRQLDVRLVRELMAHTARVATGRSRAEQLIALDEDDVRHTAARQVISDARAHAPATNYHGVGVVLHVKSNAETAKAEEKSVRGVLCDLCVLSGLARRLLDRFHDPQDVSTENFLDV